MAADKFTDVTGNDNLASNTASVTIDTVNPEVTVAIATTPLDDAGTTAQVTFTFSEAIDATTFSLDDATVTNGALSNLVIAADGLSATATFTATDGVSGTGSVSVAADKFTDVTGNDNLASNTASVTIDTVNPYGDGCDCRPRRSTMRAARPR